MKILWVSDHTLKSRPAGGAELTDFYMIQEGIRRGHEIHNVTPPTSELFDPNDYDFVVLSNNAEYQHSTRLKFLQLPYVVYCHDCLGWKAVYREVPNLFEKSLANIFLSPLHLKFFGSVPNAFCVPPHIPERFKDLKLKRIPNSVLYVGNIWDGPKGANNLWEYINSHPEQTFYFCYHRAIETWVKKFSELPNVKMLGHIPHERMPEVFNKYEYFIHLPNNKIEAFGRAVAEAYLCGCKMIVNDYVGAFSYRWSLYYDYFREKTLNSPKEFWETIEESLK